MPESTARAERFEPRSVAKPFYLWDVPGKPLSVRVSLDVIESLEREVVASFRSVSNRGSEIGGLLLGRVVAGPRPVISVEAYEPVACDYTRGPLYRLSQNDLAALDKAIREQAGRQLEVTGIFRSNTRKDLACDHDDLALMRQRFSASEQVLLLIKPYATKPATAGFFIWEGGGMAASSPLEFPFNRPALVAANAVRALAMEEEVEAAPPVVQPPQAGPADMAAAPPPAKPAVRAQVVPIASRREPPVAPPLPAISEAEKPAPAEEAPAALATAGAPPDEVVAEVVAAEFVAAEPPPAQAEPEQVRAEPPLEPIRALFSGSEIAPRRQASRLPWLLGAAALVSLLVVLFVYPGLLNRRAPAPPAPAAVAAGLSLRVERTGGQLLLTWDREAEAVKAASRAVLTISDGPQQENVHLDLAQLRNGSVVYSPVTGDVSFRLEVAGPKPELNRSEHVRVLGTRPSAMPPQPEADRTAAVPVPAPAPATAQAAVEEQASEPAPAPAPPRESLSARIRPESLGGRLRPAAPSDLPEPPSLDRPAAASGSPSTALPAGLGQAPDQPSAPPAAAPIPRIRVGGQVQEAVVISRVEPVYPPLARQSRVNGIVQIEALIGKDGAVKSVKVINGHPLLRQAAAEAVKKWVYRPTLLNGEAVEVTTRVAVGFSLTN